MIADTVFIHIGAEVGGTTGAALQEASNTGQVLHGVSGIGISQYISSAGNTIGTNFDAGTGCNGLCKGVMLNADNGFLVCFLHRYAPSLRDCHGTYSISGIDFVFNFIGSANMRFENDTVEQFGFGTSTFNATLSYLEVRERTKLSNVYEWKAENGTSGKFVSVNATSDGNRIFFAKEEDGVVDTDKGTFTLYDDKLKFEAKDFLSSIQSCYVAITVHDKNFVPTWLNQPGVEVGAEVQMYKKVTVLPASVVYYEDDFPAVHYFGTKKNSFTELSNVSEDYSDFSDTKYQQTGSSENLTQSPDQDQPYGNDDTYQDSFSNISGGTMHTIAINNDGPLVWFGFRGQGFEIDARTNACNSGMLLVKVFNRSDITFDSNGNPTNLDSAAVVEAIPVITEFDNGNTVDGSFNKVNGGAESIYQVPIIRFDGSGVKDYVVVIYGIEMLDYDNNMEHLDTYLYLDGIKVYRPMGTDITTNSGNDDKVNYYGDQNNAIFEEVRNHITNGNLLVCQQSAATNTQISTGTMTWTEKYNTTNHVLQSYQGNAVHSVNDYLMDGPNNEVYLDGSFTNGAIAFYVRELTATNVGAKKLLHLGVRALDAGMYYGGSSTGTRANLYLGVLDSDGNPAWMFLETVSSSTEQYINIPFEMCPTVTAKDSGDSKDMTYYQVVIRVDSFDEKIPAMVSFSNIKRTSGLKVCTAQFEAHNMEVDEFGQWEYKQSTYGFRMLERLSAQMASYEVITENEVEPGAYFEVSAPEVEAEPVITPKYPSLSLDDEVIYNVYFETTNMDGVDTDSMGLMIMDAANQNGTMEDALDVIPGAWYNETTGYYMVRTNGIPAKQLGDTVYFKVYAQLDDGTFIYSKTYSYSAVQYAQEIFRKSSSDDMKALCVAMLEYGAAAQQYFGYKTDALMNASLTAEQKALIVGYNSAMYTEPAVDAGKSGAFASTGTGFARAYPTVSFDGAFAINYYFTANQEVGNGMKLYFWTEKDYNNAAELTADNASGVVQMETISDGVYFYRHSDIAAKMIDEAIYVAVVYTSDAVVHCSGVKGYSISAYCNDLMENSTNAAGQMFAEATVVYGYYAEKYFA